MTSEEIEVYKNSIGKKISLFGFTSTTLDKRIAESFAWDNEQSKHHKVVFHIQWN